MKTSGILFLAAILFMSNIALAQVVPFKGYIITNNNDTIHGFILNNGYHANSKYCDFKKDKHAEVKRYTPNDLLAYRFNNWKYYVVKDIDQGKVFMEYIVNGNLDFYFYQDEALGPHYYVEKEQMPLTELIYDEALDDVDITQSFTMLLQEYTVDCPEIQPEIELIDDPDHEPLVKFAEKYHQYTCDDGECIIYQKKIPRRFLIKTSAGLAFPLSIKGTITNTATSADYAPMYECHFLFQYSNLNENVYMGIGAGYSDMNHKDQLRIPISLTYMDQSKKASPMFAYEVDVNSIFSTQAIKAGYRFQTLHWGLELFADMRTKMVLTPFSSSVNLGLSYNFK